MNPADSPGRMVIDGGFAFHSGKIVLEVESNGMGGFLTDEIVFTGHSLLDLTGLNVEFSFLGNTDPNAFRASGRWILDTFFKTNSGLGTLVGDDQGISALLMGTETLNDLFDGSIFAARADDFQITQFSFDPSRGVTSLVAIPEPGTLALLVLGSLLLVLFAHPRRAKAQSRALRFPEA